MFLIRSRKWKLLSWKKSLWKQGGKIKGLVRDSNPGHLAARIIPLDQRATLLDRIDIGTDIGWPLLPTALTQCTDVIVLFICDLVTRRESSTLSENHTPRPTSRPANYGTKRLIVVRRFVQSCQLTQCQSLLLKYIGTLSLYTVLNQHEIFCWTLLHRLRKKLVCVEVNLIP